MTWARIGQWAQWWIASTLITRPPMPFFFSSYVCYIILDENEQESTYTYGVIIVKKNNNIYNDDLLYCRAVAKLPEMASLTTNQVTWHVTTLHAIAWRVIMWLDGMTCNVSCQVLQVQQYLCKTGLQKAHIHFDCIYFLCLNVSMNLIAFNFSSSFILQLYSRTSIAALIHTLDRHSYMKCTIKSYAVDKSYLTSCM